MKKKFIFALALILALSVALLAACQPDNPPPTNPPVITLDYNYAGASDRTVTANADGTFSLGADPVRDDYDFGGWYTDAACSDGNEFTAQTVTSDVTIYAKWTPRVKQFTVTYDRNGTLEKVTVTQGQSVTVADCTVQRDGYKFAGKYTAGGVTYNVGDTFVPTENITLVAVWTRVYKVTFNLNGGTASYDTEVYVERNGSIQLPAAPDYPGRTFAYWEDNWQQQFQPGTTVTITDDNTTFTARWGGAYTLSFDANNGQFAGGVDPSGQEYTMGQEVTLPAAPTRDGYIFLGWGDGINTYPAEGTYEMGARNTTLSAQWERGIKVTFHDNTVDRSVDDVVVTVRRGSRISEIPEPTEREFFRFGGWYSNAECTVEFMFASTDITQDTDLYAKWTHIFLRFTETEDGQGWYVAGPSFNETRNGKFTPEDLACVPETLRLPDTYEGKPVQILAKSEAFRYLGSDSANAYLGDSPLHKIIIPASYTEIPDEAFYWVHSVKEYEFEQPSQVKRIGVYAFYNNYNVVSIDIPSSVTELGNRAFLECYNLKKVDLSQNNLTEIPELAFSTCLAMDELLLPDGITKIGAKAFHACPSLTTLNLPSQLTYIGNGAFGNYSGVEAYALSGDLWEYYVSVEDDSRPNGFREDFRPSHLEGITIPANVSFIGDFAFAWHKNAQYLTFENPDNLKHIGAFAFSHLESVSEIALPANLEYLGYEAERDASGVVTGFKRVDSYYNYDIGVQIYGEMQLYGSVFEGCKSLTSLAIPDCVQYLPPKMFKDCEMLSEVTFANSDLQMNGSWQAFMNCKALKSFEIPASVTLIADETFRGSGLQTLTFAKNSVCETIFCGVFKDCVDLASVILPDSIKNIAGEAFYGCTSLTELQLPASLENLGTHYSTVLQDPTTPYGDIFAESGITSLTLPEKVSYVAPYAFENMHQLTRFEMVDKCALTSLYTVRVNNLNVTYAFRNDENLQTIKLGDKFGGFSLSTGVGSLFGMYAFEGCDKLTAFETSATSENLTAYDGILFSGGTTFAGRARTLMVYPNGKADATFRVPETVGGDPVAQIHYYAFCGNQHLEKVVFHKGINAVFNYAFFGVSNLREVEFEADSEISTIGLYAFTMISTYPQKNGTYDTSVQPTKAPLVSVTIRSLKVPTHQTISAQVGEETVTHHAFMWSTENPEFKIKVPASLLDEYKAADGWKLLADYIVAIDEA